MSEELVLSAVVCFYQRRVFGVVLSAGPALVPICPSALPASTTSKAVAAFQIVRPIITPTTLTAVVSSATATA